MTFWQWFRGEREGTCAEGFHCYEPRYDVTWVQVNGTWEKRILHLRDICPDCGDYKDSPYLGKRLALTQREAGVIE